MSDVMPTEDLIEALDAKASWHEEAAAQLRRTIAVLEGADLGEVGDEEGDGDRAPLKRPSRKKAGGNRGGSGAKCEVEDDECFGDVLTAKSCKHCGEEHSRCEGHGGRRGAAVAHVHQCSER